MSIFKVDVYIDQLVIDPITLTLNWVDLKKDYEGWMGSANPLP